MTKPKVTNEDNRDVCVATALVCAYAADIGAESGIQIICFPNSEVRLYANIADEPVSAETLKELVEKATA